MKLLLSFLFLVFWQVAFIEVDAESQPQRSQSFTCLQGASNTNEIPADADETTCTTGCSFTYAKMDDQGLITEKYYWGCAEYSSNPYPGFYQCGDVQEWANGYGDGNGNQALSEYSRTCTCCSDNCNKDPKELPGCLDELIFSKLCYADANIGQLDSDVDAALNNLSAAQIPITQTMVCAKVVSVSSGADVEYQWIGLSLPTSKACGDSFSYNDSTDLSVYGCTCCGSLCNDQTYDDLSSANENCSGDEAPSTTSATTTSSETTETGRFCYVAESTTPQLPSNAVLKRCPSTQSACEKYYVISRTENFDSNSTEIVETYYWECTEWLYYPLPTLHKCGDNFEVANGVIINQVSYSTFVRTCTCCTDGCNDDRLDGECIGPSAPLTKQCHGNRNLIAPSPNLPQQNVILNVTEAMSCFKSAEGSDASTESFEWGAVDVPADLGGCGATIAFQYEEGQKGIMCSCCDDLCNDQSYDQLTIASQSCETLTTTTTLPSTTTLPVGTGHLCFSAQSDSPQFPGGTLIRCNFDVNACEKRHTYEYKTTDDGRTVTTSHFNWGCAAHLDYPQERIFTCGDEVDLVQLVYEDDVLHYQYVKSCTCCNERCNDASLDELCNVDLPPFTKQCWVSETIQINPTLPTSSGVAVAVDVPEQMSCFKTVKGYPGTYGYLWGAFTPPSRPDAQCGSSFSFTNRDGFTADTCTCCESLCNDASYDHVTWEHPSCDAPETTPSISTISTTTLPPGQGHVCFSAQSDSPQFPGGQLIRCDADVNACEKRHSYEVKTTDDGQILTTSHFTWGCAAFLDYPQERIFACGDEVDLVQLVLEADGMHHQYVRSCSCCNEKCNDANMDELCNSAIQPSKKQCWLTKAALQDDPTLPTLAVAVDVPEQMSCFKTVRGYPGFYGYFWGAFTPPAQPDAQCGSSFSFTTEDGFNADTCTCCDSLCNDASYDHMTWEHPSCDAPDPTPSTSTTHQSGFYCYVAESSTPQLPENAALTKCPSSAHKACEKVYKLSRKTNLDSNATEIVESYTWQCAIWLNYPLSTLHQCGDEFELANGFVGSLHEYSDFIRTCTCCTDGCNDKGLDGKCLGPSSPLTKQCHGSNDLGVQDPVLSRYNALLNVTETMSCFKSAQGVDANHEVFDWGAVDIPPSYGGCGVTISIRDDAVGVEGVMCTCCDDLCNDNRFDQLTLASKSCEAPTTTTTAEATTTATPTTTTTTTTTTITTTPASAAINCFVGTSVDGNLPQNAPTERCLVGCQKKQTLTLIISPDGKVTDSKTEFVWGCIDNSLDLPIKRFHKCGEIAVYADGKVQGNGMVTANYFKACTCCWDKCNSELDNECNEPLSDQLSRKCYSAGADAIQTIPTLPDFQTAVIPVPELTVCFKALQQSSELPGAYEYSWGAIDLPLADEGGQCGDSFSDNYDGYYAHVCTCCGDLCNGKQYDHVSSDNPTCASPQIDTTTTTAEPSKPTTIDSDEPSSDDTTLYVIIGVVTFLFLVTSIGMGYFAFKWYKKRQQRGNDMIPMMPTFDELTEVEQPTSSMPTIVRMGDGRAIGYSNFSDD